MLHKTRGVFLQKINYSETSLIIKVYTEAFGIQAYLLKGARSPKSRFKANMLQHLVLLEMEVYHRDNANLQRIKELRILHPYKEVPYSIKKGTIALFINELLLKSLQEEESSPGLFEFIYKAMVYLDDTSQPVKRFHLLFMIQLSAFLGFSPHGEYSDRTPFFDLMEGVFVSQHPLHTHFMEDENAKQFSLLKGMRIGDTAQIKLDTRLQASLLQNMVEYYKLHLPGMGELKSLPVLQSILA